jgi:glutathione S-transferase
VILYESPVSGNCYKVRLLAAHLGLPLERRTLDVVDRSDRPGVIGRPQPGARVPTLVLDDGRPLAESGAILWYFGDGTRFVPADAYERAQVLQWMFFEQYDHEPTIAVARFCLRYAPNPEQHADKLPRLHDGGYEALGAMERRLIGPQTTSSATRSRSPTSRSTATRTSRTRAASTWAATRPCRSGSPASRPSPGTSPSTPELPSRAAQAAWATAVDSRSAVTHCASNCAPAWRSSSASASSAVILIW